jgi:DNA-binding CsgD family transcriptional regulator
VPTNRIDLVRLKAARGRLGDAAIDPDVWPEVMEEISVAVGAAGAILLQADARTPDVPRTAAVDELFTDYFKDNWHVRDVHAPRSIPRILSGEEVVTDQDILTREKIEREPIYNELGRPHGVAWFGLIGFWSGTSLWGLSVQRTAQAGPFNHSDKRILANLSRPLTEAATLSTALGRTALMSATGALDSVHKPAIALDRRGGVLDVNAAAAALFTDDLRVRNRRLFAQDKQAQRELEVLLQKLVVSKDAVPLATEPILVRRASEAPIVVRALPVPAAARSPFLGARAILTFTVLESNSGPSTSLLVKVFGLSPAEARLASIIAQGTSPEQAAEQLGIARETARNQLKAVFAKTGTHRQGELIAPLAKL